jgi:2-dehydro-3-deoxygluconokinase
MRVVTFGEAMIRLSPPNFLRLEQTNILDITVGGGELNVAIALSRLSLDTEWVSALPKNPLGYLIRNKAREHGVETKNIYWNENARAGLYFLEFGAAPRASNVLYDRANSAISQIKPGEIDWNSIFQNCDLFHVSGITPALSDNAAEVTWEAVQAAKKSGCQVSYDLNYRGKLWSPEKAKAIQTPLMSCVDILITTEEDTEVVFDIKEDTYEKVAEKLAEVFNFKVVTITLRETPSVWKNTWTAIAYADGKIYRDNVYDVEVVDRVGSGDSYSAGFIYGYLKEGVQAGVRYGNVLSALKHSNPGDFNWSTLPEVERLLKNRGLRITR